MKRCIANAVALVLIALLIVSLVPISYMLRGRGPSIDNSLGYYAEDSHTLDMIYIGGSASFVFWEPLRAWEKSGLSSYNLGHSNMTPEAIKYFVIEALKTQSPDLFLIDLRPFQYGEETYRHKDPRMYSEVPIRNGTDHIKYSWNRVNLINASVPHFRDRLSYYFDIIKYHSRWSSCLYALLTGNRSELDYADGEKKHLYKGFYFRAKTKPMVFQDYSAVTDTQRIPPEVDRVFIDLLEYCKNQELNVLFIVHSYCQKEQHKMEYNYMGSVIEQYGFDFLNTNDYWQEIGLNYSVDMFNGNHVNLFGAEKYTDFLLNYLQENYHLPDHRGEAGYEEWDELAVEFELETYRQKNILLSILEEEEKSR